MLKKLTNKQIEFLIDEWIHNKRNRNLAKEKLIDGIGFEQLSEDYKLSVTRTKTIVKEVKQTILEHFPQ